MTYRKIGIDLSKLGTRVAEAQPKTVGEQHLAGLTLLRQPKAVAKARPSVRPWEDAIIHDPTYENLVAFTVLLVSRKEFDRSSGYWRWVAKTHPGRLHECLLTVRGMKMEGRGPDNPGGYLRTMLNTAS
jgi:hypothetical protein